MSYKGHNCELTVDYEEGFTLKDGQTGAVVFNKNFPELVNSSDDGARLLWLEFRQVATKSNISILWFHIFVVLDWWRGNWFGQESQATCFCHPHVLVSQGKVDWNINNSWTICDDDSSSDPATDGQHAGIAPDVGTSVRQLVDLGDQQKCTGVVYQPPVLDTCCQYTRVGHAMFKHPCKTRGFTTS